MSRVFLIALLLSAAAHAAPVMVVDSDTVEYLDGWQLDANGWLDTSVLTVDEVIYVSSSIGNDSYDGLSGTVDGGGVGPKATIAAGLALMDNGDPDWLLLKRGDDWSTGAAEIDIWRTGGASKSAPMLFGAYGTGARPIVDGINFASGGEQYVVVQDWHLVWAARGFAGAQMWENVWFGGTSAEADVNGMSYMGDSTVVTKCIFDWHRDTGSHSTQGMYSSSDGLLVVGSYFWGNRDFERPVEWAAQTANQHAIYSQTSATDVTIDNCIVWEVTDNGLYIRGSGDVTDCLAYRTAASGSIGHPYEWDTWAPDGVTGTSARNINILSGMFFKNAALSGLVVQDNIIIGPMGSGGISVSDTSRGGSFLSNVIYGGQFTISAGTNYTLTNNTFVRGPSETYHRALSQSIATSYTTYSGTKFSNGGYATNEYWLMLNSVWDQGLAYWQAQTGDSTSTYTFADPSFVDPTRDMESYLEDVYGQGDIYADEEEAWDGFLTLVRAQDRNNWDTALEAEAINAYIRAGFEVTE